MAEKIQRYLSMTATQPGVDTFVEAQVSTEILPENGLSYRVTFIELLFTNPMNVLSADCRIRWSITRDTKTGFAALSDPDSILSDEIDVSLTTSGQLLIPQRYAYPALPGIYIVEPTIYLQLFSASSGTTNVMDARIYYEEVKLSELDILRILNNR